MQLKHPSQQLLFGEFKLGRLLGTGTFSRVYAARSILTQYDVAVKVVVKEEVPKQFLRFILRECELVQVLDHDNIVPAYEVMEDEHNLYIVMKLARDGDLLDYVNLRRRLPEDEGRIIFKQLLDAVEYAHSKRIIHRDIKYVR
jgi:serine/threonine protein kinase